jgi:hypothetical protein
MDNVCAWAGVFAGPGSDTPLGVGEGEAPCRAKEGKESIAEQLVVVLCATAAAAVPMAAAETS